MNDSNNETVINPFERPVVWGDGTTQWSHEMLRPHFERFMAEEYSKPELERNVNEYQNFQTACLFMGFVEGAWFMEAFRNLLSANHEALTKDFQNLKDHLLGASFSLNNIGREELADAVTAASELLTIERGENSNQIPELRLKAEIDEVLNRVLWTKNSTDQNKEILSSALVRTITSALKE